MGNTSLNKDHLFLGLFLLSCGMEGTLLGQIWGEQMNRSPPYSKLPNQYTHAW